MNIQEMAKPATEPAVPAALSRLRAELGDVEKEAAQLGARLSPLMTTPPVLRPYASLERPDMPTRGMPAIGQPGGELAESIRTEAARAAAIAEFINGLKDSLEI